MALPAIDIAELKRLLHTFGDAQTAWENNRTTNLLQAMQDAATAVFEELKKDFSYTQYVSTGDLLNTQYIEDLQLAIRHYAWSDSD